MPQMTSADLDKIRKRAEASLGLPEPSVRRSIRVAAGVTVPEMAALVGVTRQAVYLWEVGRRRPSGERLRLYMEALQACRGAS
jgi:DNA-binding transcriptional regulator YiaG